MQRLPAWLVAGLVAVGVLLGLVAGTAVAGADTDSPSAPTSAESATPGGSDGVRDERVAAGTVPKPAVPKPAVSKPAVPKPAALKLEKPKPAVAEKNSSIRDGKGVEAEPESEPTTEPKAESKPQPVPTEVAVGEEVETVDATKPGFEPVGPAPTIGAESTGPDHAAPAAEPPPAALPVIPKVLTEEPAFEPAKLNPTPAAQRDVAAPPSGPPAMAQASRSILAEQIVQPSTAVVEAMTAAAPVAPPQPTIVGVLSAVVFDFLQTVERIVTGPPALPPNSTVTVRSSTLQVGGIDVPADWYFPAGDLPTQLILLQHGFFAIGPMYSYTAAKLAEQTNSIVIAPTFTSNPFADGGLWLGGTGLHQAVANLFLGDRDALTASALAAGYAQQYALDPARAALPRQFALAGHSLGGALVSAVAGYLADNGAADDLAGVILFDGVPTGDQLSGALVKLAAYEARTGRYIPVRQIGAPVNLFNFIGNANQSLAAARPDRFDGVVLAGGVHMDSMQGGNPLIQFIAYLAAGFPQRQNPPAVVQLSVTWLTQWFAGDTGIGDDLSPGSTIVIDTPEGPAHGEVIGDRPVVGGSTARTRQLVA